MTVFAISRKIKCFKIKTAIPVAECDKTCSCKIRSLGFHKAWFPFTANSTTTTQKQSDYQVDKSSFTLIALFWLEIGCCRGRKWLKAWFPLDDKCD